MTEPSLFDAPIVAQVRRTDPTSSREAARTQLRRADQWKVLLRAMVAGPISADSGGRLLDVHRSIASSRLGVMERRGLVEKAGLHLERSDTGREREVLRYRLTACGHREYALLFGGAT